MDDKNNSLLPGGKASKIGRGALQAIGGLVPFASGLFSAAASAWSEAEQQKVNEALYAWQQMIQDEMREKHQTILGIMARLDMHDEQIGKRIQSEEYQKLVRKAFRNWAGAESDKKREYIRNILSNAATTELTSDEVVNLFLEWLQKYSEFHFAVIGEIYRKPGSTRSSIWENLGRGQVREDSLEADLYKLLIRDLSTGGVIRQHRETDYAGNFLKKSPPKHQFKNTSSRVMMSAFDDGEQYELTALGKQFVHYAMTDLPLKINYQPENQQPPAKAVGMELA